MRHQTLTCVFLLAFSALPAAGQQEQYPVHPDSVKQDGVPEGKVEGPFDWKSRIFPGTDRKYWVYVPAQYDPAKAACVMVVQDGLNRARGWKLPTVLDNLIHKGDMPVTIGIFIDHGRVKPTRPGAQPRFNRSFEYDSMGDRYARFLLEEILPEVGKRWNLSDDPNDRSIAGSSSGAICAFTVAWERPDEFRRVFSSVGTFVGLRGGNEYPVLVRKSESRPIRVFLQDGSNDLNIYAGSWWVANQDMLAALQFSGYDVRHDWGQGGHNGKHSTAIMPDALRWLWRDYPQPIQAGMAPKRRSQVLIPGEDWQLVSSGHRFTEGPAVNAQGEVFFTDIPNNRIHRVALDGTVSVFAEDTGGANGLMFAADGSLLACQGRANRIVRYDTHGRATVLFDDAPGNDCVVLPEVTYYTDPASHQVWMIRDGKRTVVDTGIEFPNGVVATGDQAFLLVSDTHSRWITSFAIQPDGTLAHKQKYGYLHVPDDDTLDSGADGMTVDTQGFTWVTTRLGLQVMDQLGRVHFIVRKPQDAWLSNVVFGGPELDTVFVTCGDSVYKRRVARRGLRSHQAPVALPKPGL